MNHMELPKPLRGIIPPMVTPLSTRDRLDHPGLERLIEHVLSGGVHGIFIMGTTGEGPSLSNQMRRDLIDRACQLVRGRVPVLVGIGHSSFEESLSLARHAADAGAQAVVYPGPCYFLISQAELLEHLERLVRDLPMPLYLYNMPSHTKTWFEVETVRLAARFPQVIGIKDSSGNLDYFRRLCAALTERPDFTLLVGPEEFLVDTMLMGGHGGVCAGANLNPRLLVALYDAVRAEKRDDIALFHEAVLKQGAAIYRAGGRDLHYLKALKSALSVLGLCSDVMAEPFGSLDAADQAAIRKGLQDLNLLREPIRRR